MLAKLEQHASPLTDKQLAQTTHLLCVLPKAKKLPADVAGATTLNHLLARRDMKAEDLAKSPLAANLPHGGLCVWLMLDDKASAFERQSAARKALAMLLEEKPRALSIAVYGSAAERAAAAELAVYGAWLNGASLPQRKKKAEAKPLQTIALYGHHAKDGYAALHAVAEGNTLCRELTITPPNDLTPGLYRKRVAQLAKARGWKHEEYDLKKLRKMGAGAFVAVAQGSDPEDAAIVHLRYAPRGAKKNVALVGKGICFDTGGHNLKPARYMHGMHEDMNGSAVALGILLAAACQKLPVAIDCWLAMAQNHISPKAYKQNDVVTALNGTTIEIIHTDAEGRMVLADTLTLAARAKPDLMVDFATLTGSMHVALGARYSGIFSNRDNYAEAALAAGKASGERVCRFPLDADYEEGLESKIADVKQCSMEGEADHILAARFLQKFIADTPWVHMDLSASNCKGGLGAVASEVTGFGVAWGVELLKSIA